MTPSQYQLWIAVYNAGIKQGLSAAQALANAEGAAQALSSNQSPLKQSIGRIA